MMTQSPASNAQGNVLSDRTVPALQRQQRWLDKAWTGYEAAVSDGREPNEDSMKQLLARDRYFQMAMDSAVRAGLDQCINAPGDCAEAFVSCHHCTTLNKVMA